MDFTPRSPAVADNVAAFPEPEDDRIARDVLDLKLSGAEGEQRRTTSQLCCVHLYCTCTPPLLLLNISDYVQISFHAHLKCIEDCRCKLRHLLTVVEHLQTSLACLVLKLHKSCSVYLLCPVFMTHAMMTCHNSNANGEIQ